MNTKKRLNILVLGNENADFTGRLAAMVAEIRQHSCPDLATVTLMADSWAMGPELLGQVNYIDLVYLRTVDGRPFDELREDAAAIAEAVLSHPNDPWVVLDRYDGSENPDATLKRLGIVFGDQGVKPIMDWFPATLRKRLGLDVARASSSAA